MAKLNENENENENTGTPGGLFAGGRFNTYKIAKQAFDIDGSAFPRAQQCPGYDRMAGWDAENKGWIYLVEFLDLNPSWLKDSKIIAVAAWEGITPAEAAARTANIGWDPSSPEGKKKLERELAAIVDSAGEREDRFAECFHQQDAEGCISYWAGMLRIDPAKQPNTYQLIRVARKIGEMVVMCLKAEFNVPRPSQICPAIIPMFEPPRTASYPAGHSLQSYLISYLLLRVMPGLPQSPQPAQDSWDDENQRHQGLFALARRVADNRVIGGVHYDIDSKGGFWVAREMDSWFKRVDEEPTKFPHFAALLAAARAEFPQYQ